MNREIHIPTLVVIPQEQEIVTIGLPELLLDGKPFPFETVGKWDLSFAKDDVATLTVRIPVRLSSAE